MIRYLFIVVCVMMGLPLSVHAQSYQSALLKRIAQLVNPVIRIDSTDSQGYCPAGRYRGHDLVAQCDSENNVLHLGLKLFKRQYDFGVNPSVLDFLERYYLELAVEKEANRNTKMTDDKVFFRKGKPADLLNITDTTAFSITTSERFYEVKWMDNSGLPLVELVFPVQYDLIYGMNQSEIQNLMKSFIRQAPKVQPEKRELTGLVEEDDHIYVLSNHHYVIESLNDAIYYEKKKRDYIPLFDKHHKDLSAANLMLGIIPDVDYRMVVTQSVYGLKSIQYTTSLQQWLNYCRYQNLRLYFSVEEEREDGLSAIVIAHSEDLGYNHLLSIIIPDKFVTNSDETVLKVKMTPFIPSHNIKDLYQQYSTKKKKVIQ